MGHPEIIEDWLGHQWSGHHCLLVILSKWHIPQICVSKTHYKVFSHVNAPIGDSHCHV